MADAMKPSKTLVDFYRTALLAFQTSNDKFTILSTVGRGHDLDPQKGAPKVIKRVPPPQRLVVLDSSFNPPTLAHMRMATSALRDQSSVPEAGQDRVLLLLSVNNADKGTKPAAFEQRLVMMHAFARDLQRDLEKADTKLREQELPPIDLGLTKLPYFPDKSAVIEASDVYGPAGSGGGVSPFDQIFLAGFDTLIRIFSPKYYGSHLDTSSASKSEAMHRALSPFFQRARLRITVRPGADWGEKSEQTAFLDELWAQPSMKDVAGDWSNRVELVELIESESDGPVSSTAVRRIAKSGDWTAMERMVPPEVVEWIKEEGLYQEDNA